MVLVRDLPPQQAAIGLGCSPTLVHDPDDFAGDWHLDAVVIRDVEHGAARLHALRDLLHLRDDLVDLATFTQLLADITVTRLRADARGDQVAHAREPGEGDLLAAHRHTEPR